MGEEVNGKPDNGAGLEKDRLERRDRVAVLTEIISPYRIPFLNALASDKRDDLRAAIDLLDENVRNEKGFEFISSSASPLSLRPVRLAKRLVTASVFAAALVMCFLLVRDIWRSGTT